VNVIRLRGAFRLLGNLYGGQDGGQGRWGTEKFRRKHGGKKIKRCFDE